MRILDKYIGRQVLFTTLVGVVVLSFVLVLGNLFKEIRPLLVESGAPLSIVLEFVLQVLPFSLMFTLPWGFLTAVLLVFGRLSADNEFTAMRMAGLSLWRISAPVFVLAAVLSALCYYVNIEVAPHAKSAIGELLIKAATHDPKSLLREGQDGAKFSDQQVLIDTRQGDIIYGMHLYQPAQEGKGALTLHAQEVEVSFDAQTRMIDLLMHRTFVEEISPDGVRQTALVDQMPWTINLGETRKPKRKPVRFTNDELYEELANPQLDKKERAQFETEITRRITFALACLVFAFIGVPLAIQTKRKDTSSGFAYGILIAALYFVTLIFADLSRKNTGILPHILLWLPNVLGIIVGIYFFKRARLQS